MQRPRRQISSGLLLFGCLILSNLIAPSLSAQQPQVTPPPRLDKVELPKLSGLSDLLGSQLPAGPTVQMSARYLTDASGKNGTLQVKAEIAEGWHVYSLTQMPGGPMRSEITLVNSDEYRLTGPFRPTTPPHKEMSDVFEGIEVESHSGVVFWEAPFTIIKDIDPAGLTIRGFLKGQACKEACQLLQAPGTSFAAEYAGLMPVLQEAQVIAGQVNPTPPAAGHGNTVVTSPVSNPETVNSVDSVGESEKAGLASMATGSTVNYFLTAALAGFILNFMPCVLPVIGLKVMSFVQQAGESRGRVLWLNVCFVSGMMLVFMLLAALAALAGWGWGGLFQLPEFSIAMACVVFVFALSFLGVWEIPSPGFVGTGKTAQMSQKEGATGAFFKGVLTTLLATPCTGPFLGSTLSWAVKQPTPVIFGTFACLGLGMGLPYIIFALVPGLMSSILPKPGAWMDTFKQVMGFVLLFTVVWLFYSMDKAYFVPTFALLIALWAACWAVGRVPITAAFGIKVRTYLASAGFAAILGYLAFTNLIGEKASIDGTTTKHGWPVYTQRADIDERTALGQHVFVDFTADW